MSDPPSPAPFLILVAVLLVAALFVTGCCSSRPAIPEPVEVPVYEVPPELPVPPEPEWETCQEPGEGDWRGDLDAIVHDLLAAWQYIEELRHVIESYNAARPDDCDERSESGGGCAVPH